VFLACFNARTCTSSVIACFLRFPPFPMSLLLIIMLLVLTASSMNVMPFWQPFEWLFYYIYWAKKTGLFLRVDSFTTLRGMKACNMSKVSKFLSGPPAITVYCIISKKINCLTDWITDWLTDWLIDDAICRLHVPLFLRHPFAIYGLVYITWQDVVGGVA